MIRKLPLTQRLRAPGQGISPCEHRTVSKAGRITCRKIAEGDNEVSPNVCRSCPKRAVNCSHLRFSLRQTAASPLIVRFNGRTEIWDNDPPEIRFEQAACAARVIPIESAKACAACPLRQPVSSPVEATPQPAHRVSQLGTVVPFPAREAAAAAG
jgi:hypothetical protein